MKQSILNRAFAAITAVALVISQVVLPTSVAKAAAGEAPPNGWQPVWCQYTGNIWQAQPGDTGGGSNHNRYPLTEIPANASGKLAVYYNADLNGDPYMPMNMVYTSDGNDQALKTDLADYCYDQYAAPVVNTAATICDSLATASVAEGTISVTITNTDDPSNKAATYGVYISNVSMGTVTLTDGETVTKTYTGYIAGIYTVRVTNSEDLKGAVSQTVTVTDCVPTPITETPFQVNPICDFDNDEIIAVNGANYTVVVSENWVNHTKTITFTANTGYVFAANNSTVYTVDITDSGYACEIDAPTAPTISDPCGPDNAIWNIPADTATVKWYLNEEGALVAEAQGNNLLPGGHKTYVYGLPTDSNAPCPVPLAPVFDDMSCELNDTVGFTIPDDENYYYTVQYGNGEESDPLDVNKTYALLRINQSITIRAYAFDKTNTFTKEWPHAYTIPTCGTPGMGGEKPVTPILPAPVKPAVAVQELPQTGAADMPNLLWTGLGVAVAVYGATYFAQRKQEN